MFKQSIDLLNITKQLFLAIHQLPINLNGIKILFSI